MKLCGHGPVYGEVPCAIADLILTLAVNVLFNRRVLPRGRGRKLIWWSPSAMPPNLPWSSTTAVPNLLFMKGSFCLDFEVK